MRKTNNVSESVARPDKLLDDLSKVVRMLREQVKPDLADTPMTAIVRLVPGLNLSNWKKISARELDQNWIALDLNSDPTPTRDCNGRNYLTGMWQSEAFARALDQALLDSHRNGLTLSLALFQVDALDQNQVKHYSLIMRALSSQIWESASEQDILGHLSPNMFALAMPGCNPFQARAMAENVIIQTSKDMQRQNLNCYPIRAGIVSQPRMCRQPASTNDLLTKARQLLDLTGNGQNIELKQRINMEKDATVEQAFNTLVMANEKHFLFTGGVL